MAERFASTSGTSKRCCAPSHPRVVTGVRVEHDRGRPGEKAASNVTTGNIHSLSHGADDAGRSAGVPELSRSAVARAHAVLVWTPGDERYQRRLFLSLHGADAAMRRARDRGLTSSCVLVELVPVPGVPVVVVGGDDR